MTRTTASHAEKQILVPIGFEKKKFFDTLKMRVNPWTFIRWTDHTQTVDPILDQISPDQISHEAFGDMRLALAGYSR